MTIYRIAASASVTYADPINAVGAGAEPQVWFIDGIGYLNDAVNPRLLAYYTARPGTFTLTTPGSVPAAYTTAATRLAAKSDAHVGPRPGRNPPDQT